MARAFEPGCSIGVLTERLATICGVVEAMDISPTAVSRARKRCQTLENVRIKYGALPDGTSDGAFDLIVLSEICYYFTPRVLAGLADRLVKRLPIEGVLLAEHWLGNSRDHQLTGNQVHEILDEIPGIVKTTSQRHDGFRIDRWLRI